MNFYDYETMGLINWRQKRADSLDEAFAGTEVVKWSGRIESQLVNMLAEAEKGRNYVYADKIREYLKIWRANEITGSMNRETLEILKAASDILSVDQWDMANYFRSLKDQLKVLIASEEQLPRGMEEPGNEPMAGGGGGAGGPPMSPAFGPGGEGEEGGPGGAGGGAGGPGGGAGGMPPEGGPEGEMPPGAEGDVQGTEPTPGTEEAPGAAPGAPAPEDDTNEVPEPEDMPTGSLGLA